MAHRGYSAYMLTRVLQDEVGGGPADSAFTQVLSHQLCVHAGCTAGQDQQGLAVEVEDQAVGDCREVAFQCLGRRGCRRDSGRKGPHGVAHAGTDQC